MSRSVFSRLAIAGFLMMLAPCSVNAGTAELRGLVAADASLQHLYTFEGATDAERRQDSEGSVDLVNVTGASGGNAANIAYLSGFDGTSTVYAPEYTGTFDVGAGLQSTANVNWSNTLTVESIVRADGASGNQYVIAGPGTGDGGRGYWLYTQPTKFRTAVSNTGGLNDASTDIAAITTGHWYYVVSTYEQIGSNVTINSYIADLSAHQTTLNHVIVDDTRTNPYGSSSKIGVGMFSGGSQEFFDGRLDEVAVYNSELGQSTLQSHLDGYYTFSAPTSGNVTENFDTAAESGLHPALEDVAGSYTFTGDVAENTGPRSYVRTRATDYNLVDFVAEITFTLPAGATGPNAAYFGIGGGMPDGTEFNDPIPAFYFQSGNLRVEQDAGESSPDSVVATFSAEGDGTHRLRIAKSGDDVTFSVDFNFAGGSFVVDESQTLSLAGIAPYLDDTNSRIFFGSENTTTRTVFDDLLITVIPTPAALPAGIGLLGVALMRRRK